MAVFAASLGCSSGSTAPDKSDGVAECIGVDSSPSWSLDDNFVYYRHEASDTGDAGGIYRVEVYDGWREPVLLDGTRQVHCPKACPCRPELAFVLEGDVYVFDIFDETIERWTYLGGCANPDWSPDGRFICLERDNGTIWIVDPDSARCLTLEYGGQQLSGSSASWAPDGLSLSFAGRLPAGSRNRLAVYSIDLHEMEATRLFASNAEVSCLDWDPPGAILALSSTPELSVSTWTRETGGSPKPWFPGTEASWSMEGDRVVYVAPDMGGFLVLWLRDLSEPDSEPRQLTFGIGGFLAEEVPSRVSNLQPESR
jgi:WD40 repeat protein